MTGISSSVSVTHGFNYIMKTNIKSIQLAFLMLIFISCSSMQKIKENSNISNTYKIRYLNLNLIIEYMVNNDPDAKNIKKKKEDILQKIDSLADMQASKINVNEKKDIIEKQNQYRLELADIRKEEENYKSKILNNINKALENVAKKSDIDFIFNIGEGTVYAKKEFDITEEVLREIIKQKDKSSPVTR
jgi:Skp family chaperone for outer membrane proteins